MNDFLSVYKPSLFLFENVDSIDDAASGQCSDMDLALVEWANMGYECQKVIVNSHQLGIPASRNRLLVIGVQSMANASLDLRARPLSCIFTTMRSLIRVCQRSHTCASGVLLAAASPAVRAELIRRQEHCAKKGGLRPADLWILQYRDCHGNRSAARREVGIISSFRSHAG